MQNKSSQTPFGKNTMPTNTVTSADVSRINKAISNSAVAPKAGGKFKKFIKQ